MSTNFSFTQAVESFARVNKDQISGSELISLDNDGKLAATIRELTTYVIKQHLQEISHTPLEELSPFGRELLKLTNVIALGALLKLGSAAGHSAEDFDAAGAASAIEGLLSSHVSRLGNGSHIPTDGIVDGVVADSAAIAWTKISKLGATPNDIGAQPMGDYANLINGVIPTSQLPSNLSADYTVNSEQAMLALPADVGDSCVRTDLDPIELFTLLASPATSLTNWRRITDQIGVQRVNGQTGTVILGPADIGALPVNDPSVTNARTPLPHRHTSSDVSGLGSAAAKDVGDFDASGAASSAIANHRSETDPHSQYLFKTDSSVTNARTPTAHNHAISEVLELGSAASRATTDFDPAGAATTSVSTHEGKTDPHTQYLLKTDTSATNSRTPTGSAGGVLAGTYPNPTLASPDLNAIVALSTTLFGRDFLTLVDATAARGKIGALSASDPSVTNARIPTGSAGGSLAGTYPNPALASADLNAIAALSANSGFLQRATDGTWSLLTAISASIVTGLKALAFKDTVADADVALGAAIGWSKISKSGATASDVGALSATDPSVTNSRTPTGNAGGALSGTYPNPTLANADLNAIAALSASSGILQKTAIGTWSLLTTIASSMISGLGALASKNTIADTDVAASAAISWNKISKSGAVASDVGALAANDPSVTNSRTPSGVAGGSLSGSYPNPTLASADLNTIAGLSGASGLLQKTGSGAWSLLTTISASIVTGLKALAFKDTVADSDVATGAAIAWSKISKSGSVASDVGALSATDPSVTNSRTPTGSAGGALSGTYPNPTLASADLNAIAGLSASSGILQKTGSGAWSLLTTIASSMISGLGVLAAKNTIADADVATSAAIAWSKISKSGATASDVGALSTTDPSVTNSRTPTGAAGGSLTGTYPNPTLVSADLNAIAGLSGTSGILQKTAAGIWSLLTSTLNLQGTNSTSTAFVQQDTGTTDSRFALDVYPGVATGTSLWLFNRNVTTTGTACLTLYTADGTANINAIISCNKDTYFSAIKGATLVGSGTRSSLSYFTQSKFEVIGYSAFQRMFCSENFQSMIGTPNAPALTATTGGNLTAATYYYKVAALDIVGNPGYPSNELSVVVSGSNNAVQLNWTAIANVSKYRVYVGTTSNGQNNYFEVATNSATDLGTATTKTAGTPPTLPTAVVNRIGTTVPSFLQQLGVGMQSPGCALQVNGGVVVGNTLTAASDPGAGNLSIVGNLTVGGSSIATPATSQTLTATSTIAITNREIIPITAASAITITSSPAIAAGTSGQKITLFNSGSFAIAIPNNGVTFQAGTSKLTISPGSFASFIFLSNSWQETVVSNGLRISRSSYASGAPANPSLGDVWEAYDSTGTGDGFDTERWTYNGVYWESQRRIANWSFDSVNSAANFFELLDKYPQKHGVLFEWFSIGVKAGASNSSMAYATFTLSRRDSSGVSSALSSFTTNTTAASGRLYSTKDVKVSYPYDQAIDAVIALSLTGLPGAMNGSASFSYRYTW